jgi:hypothetical protein
LGRVAVYRVLRGVSGVVSGVRRGQGGPGMGPGEDPERGGTGAATPDRAG